MCRPENTVFSPLFSFFYENENLLNKSLRSHELPTSVTSHCAVYLPFFTDNVFELVIQCSINYCRLQLKLVWALVWSLEDTRKKKSGSLISLSHQKLRHSFINLNSSLPTNSIKNKKVSFLWVINTSKPFLLCRLEKITSVKLNRHFVYW